MGIIDSMRRAIRTFTGKEKIAQQLTEDPTSNYRPQQFYGTEVIVNKLPLYNHFTGELMMRTDPIVRFAFGVRNAAMMQADVEVKASNSRVKAWVEKQWQCLWDHNRAKMVRAKHFGFSGLQVVCERDKAGLLNVGRVKTFRPWDCRALLKGGEVVGAKLAGQKMQAPQVIWQTFDEEYNDPYGYGLLRRMYPPWYENWMDHGAKQMGQMWNVKYAMPADVFKYPPGLAVKMPDGKQIPWRDIVREMGEKRQSGACMTIPMMYDDQGRELIDYKPPTGVAGGGQEWAWSDRCEKSILRAADVPLEVVEAQENGGFSGRSVPLMVVLSVVQMEFNEIVRSAQEMCLRPLAWLNFGGDPDFEIVPKSLVESLASDASGSAMGGSAVGSQAGERNPDYEGEYRRVPPGIPAPEKKSSSVQFDLTEHKFSSTQFNMPSNISEVIAAMARRINPEDLAEDGVERESHVTIKYGLHTNDADEVRKAVAGCVPVAIRLGKTSVFAGTEHDVVKIEVESDALHSLNAAVSKNLPCTDTYPDYKPHITVAYVKPGCGERYAKALNDCEGMVAVFDRLWFSDKMRQGHSIPLTGEAVQFDLSADDHDITEAAVAAAAERMKHAARLVRRQIIGADLKDPAWLTALETSLRLATDGIGVELYGAMNAAGLWGAAEVAASLPPTVTPEALPPFEPPSPPPLTGFLDPEDQPEARFPVVEEAIQQLRHSPVATGATWQETAEKAREGAFAVTADLTEASLARLRDLLAETIEEGGGEDEFSAKVNARLFAEGPLSENHLRTIFRTNSAAAFSGGKQRAVESSHVADSFPYRRYYATTDQRVRKEHLAMERNGLNGTAIYRADDPVWKEFQPPFDFGCRCEWSPQTVDQAARAGVTEAQEWIERAKQAAGDDDYHVYLASTAPVTPEHVAHPPFHANPEFKRL